MENPRGAARHVPVILNAAYMVRHYWRGGRTSIGREQRARAVVQLGHAVRDALAECADDDIEPILSAVVDGLRPRDDGPAF